MTENSFGERLAKIRESKGWLQRDLAFRMNVKSNTISNWEKGISRPNLDQICQLCQTLNVTSDHLLGLDKTAMEWTLNLQEQEIIKSFRLADKSFKSAVISLIKGMGNMSFRLHMTMETLECAERFISDSGMDAEWEETKQEELPVYDNVKDNG